VVPDFVNVTWAVLVPSFPSVTLMSAIEMVGNACADAGREMTVDARTASINPTILRFLRMTSPH
jgi:hypothetical protein